MLHQYRAGEVACVPRRSKSNFIHPGAARLKCKCRRRLHRDRQGRSMSAYQRHPQRTDVQLSEAKRWTHRKSVEGHPLFSPIHTFWAYVLNKLCSNALNGFNFVDIWKFWFSFDYLYFYWFAPVGEDWIYCGIEPWNEAMKCGNEMRPWPGAMNAAMNEAMKWRSIK
jgi:hypothetical protein